jgi:hypothetical protein
VKEQVESKMRLKFIAAACFMAALGLQSAHATTYDVDVVASGDSLVGTLQTNGATGVVSSADITGYNLTLTVAGQAQVFSVADSSGISVIGNALTATSSGLFFNFASTSVSTVSSVLDNFNAFFLLTDVGALQAGLTGLTCGTSSCLADIFGSVSSGNQIGVAVTPAPAALPLFGSVLAIAGFLAWRRRKSEGQSFSGFAA